MTEHNNITNKEKELKHIMAKPNIKTKINKATSLTLATIMLASSLSPLTVLANSGGGTRGGEMIMNNVNEEEYSIEEEFEDKNLINSIKTEMKWTLGLTVNTITNKNILKLKKFKVNGDYLTSLKGLEYATNLENIELITTTIKNINPIYNLKNLKSLKIKGYEINNKDLDEIAKLPNLQELRIFTNNIDNYKPIERMINLNVLSLGGKKIKDITPLKNMKNLKELYLNEQEIEDITIIGTLPNLEKIQLNDNKIKDITPLKNLKKLEEVWLNNNEIIDATPLKEIPSLKYTYLMSQKISIKVTNRSMKLPETQEEVEYQLLDSWNKTRGYSIKNNIITFDNTYKADSISIYFRTKHKELRDGKEMDYNSLDGKLLMDTTLINPNEARDFKPEIVKEEINLGGTINLLDNITNLPTGAVVKDITSPEIDTNKSGTYTGKVEITFKDGSTKQVEIPVEVKAQEINIPDPTLRKEIKRQLNLQDTDKITTANITGLKFISVWGEDVGETAKVKDLTGLEYAVNLKNIELPDQAIKDLTPIKDLKKLTRLNVGRNPITNHEILANIKTLEILDIGGTQIKDLTPIKDLTNLKGLTLMENNIEDISLLKNLVNLTHLNLDTNKISNIEVIKNFPNLEQLQLRKNQVEDITPLIGLSKLQKISLENNKIKDIKPLKNLVVLEELGLSNNQISDITPLKNLTKLSTLLIDGNHIVDATAIKDLTPRYLIMNGQTIRAKATNREIPWPKTKETFLVVVPKNKEYVGKDDKIVLSDSYEKPEISIQFYTEHYGRLKGKEDNTVMLSGLYIIDTSDIKALEYTKFKPNLNLDPVTIAKGGKINLVERLLNPPKNGTVTEIVSMDTTTSGEKTGKIKVVFSDKSELEIPITLQVTVVTEADKFKPQVEKEEIKRGGTINLLDNITNLPKGASVKDITIPAIDTKEVGTFTGKVEVTFSDGSKKQVDIPVEISKLAAEEFTPVKTKEVVDWGKTIDLTDNIKNLPDGAKVVDITNPVINTKQSGEHTGKVRITFTDKSTKEVEIPVEVKKSDSENFIPKVNPEEVIKGQPLNLLDNIENLPTGATVKDITNPAIDTNKAGSYTGKVEITFSDGSKKQVEIPVKVVVTAGMIVPVPEIVKENILPEVVGWGKAIDLTDNIKNLPEGATIKDITSPAINTKQAGTYTAKAEVTFKDGSKRVVDIPVTVNQSEAEGFTPKVLPEKVVKGNKIDLTDNIENLPNGATIKDITSPAIDTNDTKTQIATVEITFADGSKKEAKIPVVVVLTAGTITPIPTIDKENILPEIVDWGKAIDLTDNIKNLPEGAKVVDITDPAINTKQSGEHIGKVEVEFKDGSKRKVEIPVIVNKSQAETFTPEILEEEVIKGNPIDLTDNVKNLPNGATIKDISNPAIDTNQVGKQTAKAEITFADDSKQLVDISVKVVLQAGIITPVPSINPEDIIKEIVNYGEQIDLTDNILKLPEGTQVVDITKPEIDTTKSGDYKGKVEVIFPDGSKRIVEIPVTVNELKSDIKPEPDTKPQPELPNTNIINNLVNNNYNTTNNYNYSYNSYSYSSTERRSNTDQSIDNSYLLRKNNELEEAKRKQQRELDEIKLDIEKQRNLPRPEVRTLDYSISRYQRAGAKSFWIFKIGDLNYKFVTKNNVTIHQADVAPFIKNDRTFIPFRFVGYAINVDVKYDNNTRIGRFEKNGKNLEINIDTKKATKNGSPYQMEVTPMLVKDRLVAPVSIVGKAFNKTVSSINDNKNTDIIWNQATQEVIIYNYD